MNTSPESVKEELGPWDTADTVVGDLVNFWFILGTQWGDIVFSEIGAGSMGHC